MHGFPLTLQMIFNREPIGLRHDAKMKWTALGPFNLGELVAKSKSDVNHDLDIGYCTKFPNIVG